jgi:hypothetical protein
MVLSLPTSPIATVKRKTSPSEFGEEETGYGL